MSGPTWSIPSALVSSAKLLGVSLGRKWREDLPSGYGIEMRHAKPDAIPY